MSEINIKESNFHILVDEALEGIKFLFELFIIYYQSAGTDAFHPQTVTLHFF